MKRTFLLIASWVSCASAGEWQELIQKHSFAGWKSPTGKTDLSGAWTIADGVLTVKPYVHRRTDLWSVEEYGDFELEWEWKADKGANGGVKYWVQDAVTLVVLKENERWRREANPTLARAEEPTLEYSLGVEYQMADDEFEPTSLKERRSRAGGIYGLIAPDPESVKRHGEWNQSRLVAREGKIEHWLNGVKVVATTAAEVDRLIGEGRIGGG